MNKILSGALAGTALASVVNAQQIDAANVKYFQTLKGKGSYPEVNVLYTLPGEVKGYSWMDRFSDGSYTGQTQLTKEAVKNVSGMVQFEHGNRPLSWTGLGAMFNIPVKDGYANVKVLPLWINSQREVTPGKGLVGYAYGKSFDGMLNGALNGWRFDAFGEINVTSSRGKESSKGKRNMEMSYGECELTRQILGLRVGLSTALIPNGDWKMPKVKTRAVVRYDIPDKFWKKFERKK